MKKFFALLLAALALSSLLTSCGTPTSTGPDDQSSSSHVDTPAIPTAGDSDLISDTGSSDTPLSDPATVTYTCRITSPDNVDLSGIRIDICKYEYRPGSMPDLSGGPGTRYDPNRDFTDSTDVVQYVETVTTDKSGEFSFFAASNVTMALRFDAESLPEQYGLRCPEETRQISTDGILVCNSTKPLELSLEKATQASLIHRYHWDGDYFTFEPLLSGEAGAIYGAATVSSGRFGDDFIDKMISGGTLIYSGVINCGELSVKARYEFNVDFLMCYVEWRLDYLYYNNYITAERYAELIASIPSTPVLPLS